MKAIGITCGVGSLLIGAKTAGFDIEGNIEWRKYYNTGTFENNFPGAVFAVKPEDLTTEEKQRFMHCDLAMGHPECGNFSNLRVKKTAKLKDPSDIPLFVNMVKEFKPRFFVQDNLPKSLMGYSMQQWSEELPEYDLFPEWVSNYHYGNSQINRRRFFMIGALKEEKFAFVPGEFEHTTHLGDVIEGLPKEKDIPKINHIHWKDSDIMKGWGTHNFPETAGKDHVTLSDFKKVIEGYPPKKIFQYINRFGETKLRPGYSKIVLDNFCPVMTGGGSAPDNHYRADTLNPLTARERARIQGCPDDFIFYPLDYIKDNKTYMAVYKQIGKFMPVEFAEFISTQIAFHIKGKPWNIPPVRIIKPSPLISEAKEWYCKNVGYAHEPCDVCWVECQKELNLKFT